MKVLMVNPSYPTSFWSFDKAMTLLGRKSMVPPIGLMTVAAILPQEWEFRLVDRVFDTVKEADWDWADMVMISGMIVQRDDMIDLIRQSRARGKPVVVGGPYATSVPQEMLDAGADFCVLDEGEITIPLFLEALEAGAESGTFTASGAKPDITVTPLPRYDLIDMSNYESMSIQFSRGCPFLCEFCDIITLFGRKPRAKSPEQIVAELDQLYDMGWRGSVLIVDDNFIGNRIAVKPMLNAMIEWQRARNFPFSVATEASVDLAEDDALMRLMRQANFTTVFLGIETPDAASLEHIRKKQNLRGTLIERVNKINEAGFMVMGGFIIGFDGEKPGAGQRILDFVQQTQIPVASVSLMQALPTTALTDRLRAEGRMLEMGRDGELNCKSLTNFVPTRPLPELAAELIEVYQVLYSAENFLHRAHQHSLGTRNSLRPREGLGLTKRPLRRREYLALLRIFWSQGVVRNSRAMFWRVFLDLYRNNRRSLKNFVSMMAFFEHLNAYRDLIRDEMQSQLASLSDEDRNRVWIPPAPKVANTG